MPLPNALIIGAQKSGSSWLAKNLGQHPDAFIYDREIHFFNLERNYNRGLPWYEAHFEQAGPAKVIAEKTPNYLWITPSSIKSRFGNHLPNIHQKLHAALPEAKLIVVLRNPVERAISAINHYRTRGQLSPLADIDNLLDCQSSKADTFGVLSMGKYYEHLSAYYDCYGKDRLLVINFEEEIADAPEIGLQKACHFLGLDDTYSFKDKDKRQNSFDFTRTGTALVRHWLPNQRLLHKAVAKLPAKVLGKRVTKHRPSERTIQALYRYYQDDNQKLFQLLNRKFNSWEETQTSASVVPNTSMTEIGVEK
ncbi:MAG: sulfotransferase [Cyanobacteria bacterium P01_F01_bin.3]